MSCALEWHGQQQSNHSTKLLPQRIALNVKSDGLQLGIKNSRLSQVSDYYCFDMSVPDTLGYKKTLLPYFTRFSDIEPHASLLEDASGVWLDNFSDNDLNTSVLKDFLAKQSLGTTR